MGDERKKKVAEQFGAKTPEGDIEKHSAYDRWTMSPWNAGVKAAKNDDLATVHSLRRAGVEGSFVGGRRKRR